MPDLVAEAYDGVTLELPNGKQLHAQPLAYRKGLQYLRLLVEYEDGKKTLEDSLALVFEGFPGAIGVDPQELEDLSLGEMYDLVRRFLFLRRTPTASPPSTGAPVLTTG